MKGAIFTIFCVIVFFQASGQAIPSGDSSETLSVSADKGDYEYNSFSELDEISRIRSIRRLLGISETLSTIGIILTPVYGIIINPYQGLITRYPARRKLERLLSDIKRKSPKTLNQDFEARLTKLELANIQLQRARKTSKIADIIVVSLALPIPYLVAKDKDGFIYSKNTPAIGGLLLGMAITNYVSTIINRRHTIRALDALDTVLQ